MVEPEPDVAAKVWDDYLHMFRAAAYVLAQMALRCQRKTPPPTWYAFL